MTKGFSGHFFLFQTKVHHVNEQLNTLGDKSYKDLIDFTDADQLIVDEMATMLVQGDPTFGQVQGGSARHALAATIFAFENDPAAAAQINRTFTHFV